MARITPTPGGSGGTSITSWSQVPKPANGIPASDIADGVSSPGFQSQWRITETERDVKLTPAAFGNLTAFNDRPIVVDAGSRQQRILGFGAALTEGSAYLIMRRLNRTQRHNLLQEMFGPGGLSMVRIGVGGTDFNIGPWWSLDETTQSKLTTAAAAGDTTIQTSMAFPQGAELRIDQTSTTGESELVTVTAASTGTGPFATAVTALTKAHIVNRLVTATDRTLTNFNITREQSMLIPLLREILTINPALRIHASLWQVPAWMRNSVDFTNGSRLFDDARTALANYFVRFIQAYTSQGIPLHSLCLQNEPCATDASFIYYTPAQYADFVATYLGPAMDTAGLTTKLMVHDHHYAYSQHAQDVLAIDSIRPYVGGIGWHGYSGSPAEMSKVRRRWPTLEHHFTEMRTLLAEDWPTSVGIMVGDVIIGSLRNWASSVTLWNLILDEKGDPSWGTAGRRGVVTIPSDGSGSIVRNVEYLVLRRLADVVQPGAHRVASSSYSQGKLGTDLQSVAFINPDESVAVLAWNASASPITTQIIDGRTGQGFPVTLAAGEVSVFAWGARQQVRPAAPAAPTFPAATSTPVVLGHTAFQNATQTAKEGTYSYTVPAGSNQCLVVAVQSGSGNQGVTAPLTVELDGVPMRILEVADTRAAASGTQRIVTFFYALAPTVGVRTLRVRLWKESPFNVRAITLGNVSQVDPFGVPSCAISSGATTVTAPLREVRPTDLVLAAVAARTSAAVTAGTNETILGQAASGNSRLGVSTSSSTSPSFTLNTTDAIGVLAVPFHGA